MCSFIYELKLLFSNLVLCMACICHHPEEVLGARSLFSIHIFWWWKQAHLCCGCTEDVHLVSVQGAPTPFSTCGCSWSWNEITEVVVGGFNLLEKKSSWVLTFFCHLVHFTHVEGCVSQSHGVGLYNEIKCVIQYHFLNIFLTWLWVLLCENWTGVLHCVVSCCF